MFAVFEYQDKCFVTKVKKLNAGSAHRLKKAVDSVQGSQYTLTVKEVLHGTKLFKRVHENGTVFHFVDTIQTRNIPKSKIVQVILLPDAPFFEIV